MQVAAGSWQMLSPSAFTNKANKANKAKVGFAHL
jgi:hypothetical protein